MTREEFKTLGDYVSGLWPAWQPTEEQKEAWYHEMRATPLDKARQALHNAFTRTKWKEPTLFDVLTAIKELRRGESIRSEDTDFSPELVAQVDREAAEEAALVADWTPEEFAAGKAEVIAHEPGMAVFEGMAANGRFWTHILVERYVYHRATIFSSGIVTRNGKACRVPLCNPQQIDRDEYWKAGPQPRRVGIRSVSNGNQERKDAKLTATRCSPKSPS